MPDPRSIDNVKIGCLSIGCLRILKKVVDRISAHRKYTNTGVPVLTEPNKERISTNRLERSSNVCVITLTNNTEFYLRTKMY